MMRRLFAKRQPIQQLLRTSQQSSYNQGSSKTFVMTAAATLAFAAAITYNKDSLMERQAYCSTEAEEGEPEWAENFERINSLEDIERVMAEQSRKIIYMYRGD